MSKKRPHRPSKRAPTSSAPVAAAGKSKAHRGASAKSRGKRANESNNPSGRSTQTKMVSSKRISRASNGQDYEIGHGKPPPEYTWKPGQSGNRRGRPKGRKNEATIWKEILGRKVTVPIGGKPKKITLQEAIQYRIANDALTGNIKSAGFILNRFAMTVTGELPATEMNEDDRAVLEAFARRLNVQPPEN